MYDFSFFYMDNMFMLGFFLFLFLVIIFNIVYCVWFWSMCFVLFVWMGMGVFCSDKSVSKFVCCIDFYCFYNVLFFYEL